MALFGSFEFGTSVVYGPSEVPEGITAVDVLDKTRILVTLGVPVVVDEQLLNPDNFFVEFADNEGFTDVEVRSILPGVPDSIREREVQADLTTTMQITLVTDTHSPGQQYKVTIQNINAASGAVLPTVVASPIARRTKVGLVLKNLPDYFDKSSTAAVVAFATAFGLEDERIGGSLKEEAN